MCRHRGDGRDAEEAGGGRGADEEEAGAARREARRRRERLGAQPPRPAHGRTPCGNSGDRPCRLQHGEQRERRRPAASPIAPRARQRLRVHDRGRRRAESRRRRCAAAAAAAVAVVAQRRSCNWRAPARRRPDCRAQAPGRARPIGPRAARRPTKSPTRCRSWPRAAAAAKAAAAEAEARGKTRARPRPESPRWCRRAARASGSGADTRR